jgi:hypothetical protein
VPGGLPVKTRWSPRQGPESGGLAGRRNAVGLPQERVFGHTPSGQGRLGKAVAKVARGCSTYVLDWYGRGETMLANKRMQLTKLRAAPVLQAEVPPCAPAGKMDGGTASQLIRRVRRTFGDGPARHG